MSYTYNLSGTINTGSTTATGRTDWHSYSQETNDNLGYVGKLSSRYYVTNILFNSSSLTSLRNKTLQSITLELTAGGIDRSMSLVAAYKLNSTSADWTRSDSDSSAASAEDASILFKFNPNDYGSGVFSFTIPAYTGATSGTLTPKVPKYGLVVGPYTSNVSTRWKFTAATLHVTTNETLYTYTLSYNANGGTGAPSSQTASNIQVSPSCTFNISTQVPTRTGYTFSGWSTTSSGSVISGNTITITSTSQTLYAIWTKNSYTVKIQCLDPENAASSTAARFGVWYSDNTSVQTVTSLTVTKKYGDTIYIKDVTPYYGYYSVTSVTGMTSDGNGQYHYTLNENSANYTITIKTARVQYTVSYNANGGTGAPSNQTKYGGINLTLSSTIPTRNGYTFQTWNTKADGTGTNYASSATYTTNAQLSLYAIWVASSSTILLSKQSVDAGGSVYVYINKVSSSATHTITYSIGSRSGTIATKTSSTEALFNVPSDIVSVIPGASGQCTISCTTYIGNTQSGVAQTAVLTITVPASYKPSVSLTVAKYNTNSTVNSWGILLQGYSQVKLTATPTMASGATVSKYSFSGPGVSVTGTSNAVTSNVITTYGKSPWSVTVTDSRGRTATASWNYDDFEIYAYASPNIYNASTIRTDATGVSSTGTFLKSKANLSVSSANGHNAINVHKVEYKLSSASQWTLGDDTLASNGTWTSPYGSGTINVASAYDVRYTLSDSLGNQTIVTGKVPNVSGVGIGLKNDRLRLGGVPTKSGLQVDWNAEFNGVLDVTPRRCEATLPTSGNGAGWYRAIVYNAYDTNSAQGSSGEIVTIKIVYTSAVSVQHEISLFMTKGKVAFLNETSHGTTNLVDQIRYNYNGSTGYIDIHWTTTTACYVNVSFDVASRNYAQGLWVAGTLTSVVESPNGETELARYTFSANATPLRYTVTTTPVLVTDYGTSKFTVDAPYYDLGNIGIIAFNPGVSVLEGQSFSTLLQLENLPFIAISASGYVRSLGSGQDGMDTWQLASNKIYLRKRGAGNLLGTFLANPILQVCIIGIK